MTQEPDVDALVRQRIRSLRLAPRPAASPLVVDLQDAHDVHSAQLNIATPFAQELTGYAFSEWRRVAEGAASAPP